MTDEVGYKQVWNFLPTSLISVVRPGARTLVCLLVENDLAIATTIASNISVVCHQVEALSLLATFL